jgi:hypothetical protein
MAIAMMFGLIFVFFVMAFALDSSLWYFDHRRAENQAEAAALAGVNELPGPIGPGTRTAVLAKVDEWLGYNQSSSSERLCPADSADTTNIFDSGGTGALNAVRVCVRRPAPAIFAQLAGIQGVMVSGAATARVRMEPLDYGLMAMGSCNLLNGHIVVNTNTIVRLDAPVGTHHGTYVAVHGCPAINLLGVQAELRATKHEVADILSVCLPGGNILFPPTCTIQGDIPDPYIDLKPLPQPGACRAWSNASPNPPDRYCSVTITAGPPAALLDCSGVPRSQCFYTFTGDFTMEQDAELQFLPSASGGTPAGVTLYFTCSVSPCNGAPVGNIQWANPGVKIGTMAQPLRGNPDWFHQLIWVDPTAQKTPARTVDIRVGPNTFLAGRIYAAPSDVRFTGNTGEIATLNVTVVASRIEFSGGMQLTFPWTPDTPAFLPVSRNVALVE